MKDRQLPVVVLTLLSVGLGAATLVAGLALMGVAELGFVLSETRNAVMASLIGVAQLVVGVSSLVLAFGFWLQRSWAWGLGVAVFGLSIVLSIIAIVAGVSSLGAVIFIVALALMVVWYLYQPKVKALYGR
jgi:hypothetical protein